MPANASAAVLQSRLQNWLESIPFCYDTCASYTTEWPSLSLQWIHTAGWLPQGELQQSRHSLLLGTQTSGEEPNNLLLLPAWVPPDGLQHQPDHPEQQLQIGRKQVVPAVPPDEDVNRAVSMPSAPHVVATCSDQPCICVYKLEEALAGAPADSYTATCATAAGSCALAWCPDSQLTSAQLVTGDTLGNLVCLGTAGAEPQVWQLPGAPINYVAWHHTTTALVAAAMEDTTVQCVDIRQQDPLTPISMQRSSGSSQHHMLDALTAEFDPLDPHHLAVGLADGSLHIFDLRQLQQPLARLVKHAGAVNCMAWSALTRGRLATGGTDGFVLLWDVQEAVQGQQQGGQAPGYSVPQLSPASATAASVDDSRDPPGAAGAAVMPASAEVVQLERKLGELSVPGLVFVHAGHLGEVLGVDWHPEVPGMVASVSRGVEQRVGGHAVQEHAVQMWRPYDWV